MAKKTIGLYYPYIHFQDQNWLKRAALYWDKMGRIVPDLDDVDAEDTDLVRALKYEVGFVEDLHPRTETQQVGLKFLSLLETNEIQLRSLYGIKKWEDRLRAKGPDKNRRHGDEILETVYIEKMSRELRDSLVATGLAYAPKHHDFLIMHRRLADVYMTVLADAMAKHRAAAKYKYEPTTDNVDNHYAVMGGNLEHIKHALLALKKTKRQTRAEPSLFGVAMFALKVTVPKNIDDVSIKQIVKFRKKYAQEMPGFREDVAKFARDRKVWRSLIRNPKELQEELEEAYTEKVQETLDNFDKIIRDTWKEAAWATVFVSPMSLVGKLIPEITDAIEPVSATVAATALATANVVRKTQKELKTKIGPEAYLLHAREYFEPDVARSKRLKRWSRHFFLRM